MRKSAKILALLLTFVMLLGVVVTTAFANDDEVVANHPDINMTDDYPELAIKGNANIEGSSYSEHWDAPGTGVYPTGISPSYNNSDWPRKYGHYSTITVKDAQNNILNTYGRIWHDITDADFKNPNGSAASITDMSLYDGYKDTSVYSYHQNDYIVVDFDYTADQYIGSDNKLYASLEDVPEGVTVSLSYNTGATVEFMQRYNAAGSNLGSITLRFANDSEGWYAYINGYGNNKARLSTTPGIWNHFTAVYVVDNRVDYTYTGDNGTVQVTGAPYNEYEAKAATDNTAAVTARYLQNSYVHFYIDGVKFVSLPVFSGGYASVVGNLDNFGFTTYQLRFNTGSETASQSIGIDNLVAHYYPDEYSGPITNLFNLSTPTEAPQTLGTAKDMVYNYNYQYPAPNAPVASIKVGDTVKNYYATEFALANIEEGCTLTLYGDTKVENYVAFCDFIVVCDEGEFTLGQCQKVANRTSSGYEITKAKSTQQFTVEYYPSYDDAAAGTNEIAMEGDQNTATIDQPIFIPSLSAGTVGKVTDNGVEYKLLTKWKLFYYNGDDEVFIDLTSTTVVDAAALAIINSDNEGVACAYPVYENMLLKYIVTDAAGNLVADANGSYDYMKTIDNSFSANIEAVLNTEKDITVTLYSDINFNRLSNDGLPKYNIKIGVNTLRFDLNGHSYYFTSDFKNTMFSGVANGGKLYVYSSEAGGQMLLSSHALNDEGTARALSTGYLATTDNGGYGTYIQLGAYDKDGDGKNDVSGDNLGIYCGVLLDSTSGGYTIPDGMRGQLIINGGTYMRTTDAGAFLVLRNRNSYVEIKNAKYYGHNAVLLLTSNGNESYKDCKTTVVIENSVIWNKDPSGSVFTLTSTAASNIKISGNSLIIGKLGNAAGTAGNTITLGDGVKIAQDLTTLGTAVKIADGCEVYLPTVTAHTEKISIYDFKYQTGEKPTDYVGIVWDSYANKVEKVAELALTGLVVKLDASNSATLNMYDYKGNLIGTTTFPIGTAPSVTAVPEIDLDNPFFNLGFDKWVDENGNEFDFTACEAGKTYTAKATMKIVEDFNGAMMNLIVSPQKSLPRAYIPVPAEGGYDGYEVVVKNFNNSSKDAAPDTVITANGIKYYIFALPGYHLPTVTGGANAVKVTYTVNGVELTKSFETYSISGYLEKGMEVAKTDLDKRFIMSFVNYSQQCITLKTGSAYAKYTALLEKYNEYLPTAADYSTEIAEDAARADMSDLAPYVNATFTSGMDAIGAFDGSVKFVVVPANGTLLYPYVDSSKSNVSYIYATNKSSCYYQTEFNGKIASIGISENKVTYTKYGVSFGQGNGTAVGGKTMLYNYNQNIETYMYTADMNINLRIIPPEAISYDADGVPTIDSGKMFYVTGTYNLASYIVGMRAIENPSAEQQNAIKLAEALYAYSAVALEYITTPDSAAN